MKLLRILKDRVAEAPIAVRLVQAAPVDVPPPPPPIDFQKTMGRDQVTGLPNRACFAHLAAAQSVLATRFETRLSLLVIGWEAYGAGRLSPAARDRQLARIAVQLRGALYRSHDVLGSLGDGSFGVLLPFTDRGGADVVARKLLAAAQAVDIVPPAAPPANDEDGDDTPAVVVPARPAAPPVLEIGMACYCGRGPLAEDVLLQRAEQAAIFARLNGGDRIVRYDVSDSATN